jgi:hypothetical protein
MHHEWCGGRSIPDAKEWVMARVNWGGWAAKLAAAVIGLGALGTASAAI